MNNRAENFEAIVDVEADGYDSLEWDVVDIGLPLIDSLSVNFFEEIDAWARHSLSLNGFGDY